MDRNRHARRGPAPDQHRDHRSRSVAALAPRVAGAFLLAASALLAFAPAAEAQNVRPETPTGFSATGSTTSISVTLTWDAGTNPMAAGETITGFRIDWRVSSKNGDWDAPNAADGTETITDGAATSLTLTDAPPYNLQEDTEYDFRIRSIRSGSGFTTSWFTGNDALQARTGTPPAAPAVTGVSSPMPDGVYEAGDTIDITVAFSAAVTVTGTPTLELNPGDTNRPASYVSGSGTDTLTFRYTVQPLDFDRELNYTGTDALALPSGATIRDADGNDAALALPAPGAAGSLSASKGLMVISALPVIVSPAEGATLTFARPEFRVRQDAALGRTLQLVVVRTAPETGSCARLADLFTATQVTAETLVSTADTYTLAATADQPAGTHCYSAALGGDFISAPVKVTLDLPVPTIRLSRTALEVDEGRTATYTVRLRTQPTSSVVIDIASDNSDVTVQPAQLTFTTSNWSSARTVTASASQDDDAANDTGTLTHSVVDASSADEYDGLTATLAVTVDDDETAGITLSALSESPVPENGMATYTVVLDAKPTADVFLHIITDNGDVTVLPASLSFTPANWDTARTMTVSAADDGDSLDETATQTHTVVDSTSADEYDGLSAALQVQVRDDDVPGLTVPGTALSVGEGRTATYTVKLQVEPSEAVVVAVTSDNRDVTVDKPRLIFTSTNWSTGETVRVRAAEDGDIADDMAMLTHRIVDRESASEFRSVADETLAVTVNDNDTEVSRSIRIAPTTVNEGDGTVEIEVTVDLGEQPASPLYYAVWAWSILDDDDDRDFTGGEYPESRGPHIRVRTGPDGVLTHTLRLRLVDDDRMESNETARISFLASDTPGGEVAFGRLDTGLTITDNDRPGVRVSRGTLTVPEGGSATYTLRLNTAPAADVTVMVTTNHSEVDPQPRQLTFTPDNWDSPQTVTVSATEDDDQVDDRTTLTHTVTSTDTRYNNVGIAPVSVVVSDGGAAPPLPPPPSGTALSVADASASEGEAVRFTVRLSGEVPVEALELVATPSSGPGDSATASTDYATAEQSISIAAGQTSATFAVATVQDDEAEADETFTVTLSPKPGTSLPAGVVITRATATGTIVSDDLVAHRLPLVIPADHALGLRSITRLINRFDTAGEVRIEAFDDEGVLHGPVTLNIDANEAVQFSSADLEEGNTDKGLSGGVGDGEGDWRLELESTLDLQVLGYVLTTDGFLATMHDMVPGSEAGHRVPFFNPGRNRSLASRLRVVNPGAETAEVSIEGVDARGEAGESAVVLSLPAGTSRTLSASELESGDAEGLSGALGTGAGKWQLVVTTDRPVVVMSLLASATGYLSNLSTAPEPTAAGADDAPAAQRLHLVIPADHAMGLRSITRLVNRSDTAGEVRIEAFDDAGALHGPVTLSIGANEAVQFSSADLEEGNAGKGLSGGVGDGEGDWRLELTSTLDLQVLGYVLTTDGFLATMHDTVALVGEEHRVPFFNPGRNRSLASRLRLVNPGTEAAEVTIEGIDARGDAGESAVVLSLPAGAARTLSAHDLESGEAEGLTGALGTGSGNWQLVVTADRPVVVMSLLASATGYLSNLSTAP